MVKRVYVVQKILRSHDAGLVVRGCGYNPSTFFSFSFVSLPPSSFLFIEFFNSFMDYSNIDMVDYSPNPFEGQHIFVTMFGGNMVDQMQTLATSTQWRVHGCHLANPLYPQNPPRFFHPYLLKFLSMSKRPPY